MSDYNKLANALAGVPFEFGRLGGPYADRSPYPSERNYFAANPQTAGMAAEDNKVVMNPFSPLSNEEMEAVRRNELARVLMRGNPYYQPNFQLTPEQGQNLQSTAYANAPDDARRATVAARLYSGDPSGGTPTPEQDQFVNALRTYFGVRQSPFTVGGK